MTNAWTCGIAFRNAVDDPGCLLTVPPGAPEPVASLPLANLKTFQPRQPARFLAAACAIEVSFAAPVEVGLVAFFASNLPATAEVRASLPGLEDWRPAGVDPLAGNLVWSVAPATVAGFTLELRGGGAFIDLGRLWAGPLWRPAHNFARGFEDGVVEFDNDARILSPGGQTFVQEQGRAPRYASLRLPWLIAADWPAARQIVALGLARQLVWIADPTAPDLATQVFLATLKNAPRLADAGQGFKQTELTFVEVT